MKEFCGYRTGDTAFHQSIDIGNRLTVGNRRPVVYIKREDEIEPNFKARRIAEELQRYEKQESPLTFAYLTDGNTGYAGAVLCHAFRKGRKFASIVDRQMEKKLKRRLGIHGNYVVEIDFGSRKLSSAEIIDIVRKNTKIDGPIIPLPNIDINSGGYRQIAKELYDCGVRKDWLVYVPVGGGDLLANLVWGFEDIGEVPAFVGATVSGNYFGAKVEARRSVADKLVVPYSFLDEAVLGLVEKYNIEILTIPSTEIEEEFSVVKKAGIRTCRSSAVPFAAARRHALEGKITNGQKIAIINTGYEPEESGWADLGAAVKQHGRRAILAAAACLLPLIADSSSLYTNQQLMLEREAAVVEYMQKEKERLAREPLLADINAYAKYMGRVERTENGQFVMVENYQVFSDLTYWHFSQDMIARLTYSAGEKYSMKRNVDGFRAWKEQREQAKKSGKGYWDLSNK